MNSALRNQILADRRRDRRNDIIASVIGWTVTIAGAFVGACFILRCNLHFFINRTISHAKLCRVSN